MKGAAIVFVVLAPAVATGCSSAAPAPPCDLPNVPADVCDDAHAMLLPSALPPARGNQHGDDDAAAHLGFSIFFDSDLGTGISCATCHAPELAFTDRLPVSMGKTAGMRNAPTVFNVARLSVFFWDGRADSLWSQPLFPMENPAEMASTRLDVARFVASKYASDYAAVFGPLPDMSAWPPSGMPGDASFDGLPPDAKDQVDRLFSNVGKALEAFMRKDTTGAAPIDAFLAGDSSAVIEAAQRGLGAFLANGCASCHAGPMLTDEQFHDVGMPSLPGAAPDPGRAGGLPILQANVFNLAGPYADPGPGVPGVVPTEPGQQGAFRTPSLRNLDLTFPYGHDGAVTSLADVLAAHAPSLGAADQGDVLAFLATLDGAYPPPPWNNWPVPQ